MLQLSNSQLTITIAEHGAELTSIQCRDKEYLWQADPKFWKRHSPVLFPIVGSVWNNEYRVDGKTFSLTQHGFARDMEFALVHRDSHSATYRLLSNEQTLAKYPYKFCLEISYQLIENKIKVIWRVHNIDSKTMHFQIGAHPAFLYPDFDEKSSERGYFGFGTKKNLNHILISEKGCVDELSHYPVELNADGLLAITTQTFDHDALIIEDSQIAEVTLFDKHRNPYLRLEFNAPVVGLWSPPKKNAPFVCIEPWYGRTDKAHYNGDFSQKAWTNHLLPAQTFTGGYDIEIF